jgi:hypothetical protein
MVKKNPSASKVTKPDTKAVTVKNTTENKKKLEKVSETVVFWCNDGQIFKDMKELMDGFDTMSDMTFAYHVNELKNDFSCWVLDIIGDQKLAQELKAVRNREQAKKKVQQRYLELTQSEE